jgi:hypothetical protein
MLMPRTDQENLQACQCPFARLQAAPGHLPHWPGHCLQWHHLGAAPAFEAVMLGFLTEVGSVAWALALVLSGLICRICRNKGFQNSCPRH